MSPLKFKVPTLYNWKETEEARYLKKLFNWSNRDLHNPCGGIKQQYYFKSIGAALYIKNTQNL